MVKGWGLGYFAAEVGGEDAEFETVFCDGAARDDKASLSKDLLNFLVGEGVLWVFVFYGFGDVFFGCGVGYGGAGLSFDGRVEEVS